MQFLNFSLGRQNIDLEWPDGGYADLHNDFTFDSLHFEPSRATLILTWRKSPGEWAQRVPWQTLRLHVTGVSCLRMQERDPGFPLTEDDCLSDIWLMPTSLRDDFENVCDSSKMNSDYDLALRFQSEWGLKINAATVELQLEPLS